MRFGVIILIVLFFISCRQNQEKKNLKLWYRQPAKEWTEALSVGNVSAGTEHIQLNKDIANGEPNRTGLMEWARYFRVYGNIIGAYLAIHFPNEPSKSDKNLLGFYKSDLAYEFVANGKDNINFDNWKKLGDDTNSYVDPLIISIDPDKLMMSVKSMSIKEVPVYQEQPELLPEFTRAEELLTHDLLSKPRQGGFAVGSITDLPFDGSEISIVPRVK